MIEPSPSFTELIEHLSAASVKRRWEAYRDVPWDDPRFPIDAGDPCWVLPTWDPLGASEWYRDQSTEIRSELGLLRLLVLLKVGIEFEAVLQRGLLELAAALPDGHPAFRYVYHELTEEAQHSMMFQELINRSGRRVPTTSDGVRALFGTVGEDEHGDWSTLLLSALAAEEVFDRLQRRLLTHRPLHPLFRRVFEIHIAEEARHLTFACAYLRESVPRLDAEQRRLLRYRAPFIVGWMARHILGSRSLTSVLAGDWGMPDGAQRGFQDGPSAAQLRRSCTEGVVRLCEQLDLLDPRLAARRSDPGTAHPDLAGVTR